MSHINSVKFTDSKEKKQKWLDDMLQNDPWMTQYIYLPDIIEQGKDCDPEMVELAQNLLNKLNKKEA